MLKKLRGAKFALIIFTLVVLAGVFLSKQSYAATSNNPVFATIEKVQEMILAALAPLNIQLSEQELKIALLENTIASMSAEINSINQKLSSPIPSLTPYPSSSPAFSPSPFPSPSSSTPSPSSSPSPAPSGIDMEAPIIISITPSKSVINAGESVRIYVIATDDKSGIREGVLRLTSPSGQQHITRTLERDFTTTDTYRNDYDISAFAERGDWYVSYVHFTDYLGHQIIRYYHPTYTQEYNSTVGNNPYDIPFIEPTKVTVN